MFRWIEELLEIKHKFRERKLSLLEGIESDKNICKSCEVLKEALARANSEKDRLLSKLLEPVFSNQSSSIPMGGQHFIPPKNIPWNVRRQMLEAEDRQKAVILKNTPKSTEELEKELDIARSERESTTGIPES